MASSQELNKTLWKLVTANHILHRHGAVDGFGHVSIRHPDNPKIYIMCGYMPPALVETADDLIEYHVEGSDPVKPDAAKGYSERFIHGEIFKKFPKVQAVVHSHAKPVLPFVVGSVPLKPMVHMTGFIGRESAKLWDISPLYSEHDQQDMLVNNVRLGASLAQEFSSEQSKEELEETIVLMKRHGFTAVGPDLETVIYRTIYTIDNADIQFRAATMANAMGIEKPEAMSRRHTADCRKMTEATQDKAWRLWVREVQTDPLYKNGIVIE